MSASAEYTEYVLELLQPIGPVHTGRMFGGVGIRAGSAMFAMIMGNTLYFVVDDSTRPKYEQAGMQPFSYTTKKGRIQVRRFYELPEEVLTDVEQLRIWARESIRLASQKQQSLRVKTTKKANAKTKRKTTKRRKI
ncbi:MAG: TfoX/Sxy family protein [Gammaproteobacteria bacterium]|nr:TfoX/Sxy family protein [Gammaproteobacteria bacterium]